MPSCRPAHGTDVRYRCELPLNDWIAIDSRRWCIPNRCLSRCAADILEQRRMSMTRGVGCQQFQAERLLADHFSDVMRSAGSAS